MRSRALAVVSVVLAALGCADNLPKATKIVHMRILGTRIEIEGDASRTTPHPGETATLSLLAVFPDPNKTTENLHSMFIGCTAPARFTGNIPVCQEFLDAAKAGGADVQGALAIPGKVDLCVDKTANHYEDGAPRVIEGLSLECKKGDPTATLSVAKDFSAKSKLVIGVVCEDGLPYVDPNDPKLFGCAGGHGETIPVNALIPVARKASDDNHNPSIDDLLFLVDPGNLDEFDPAVASERDPVPGENAEQRAAREARVAPVWFADQGPGPGTPPTESDAGTPLTTAGDPCEALGGRVLDLAPNHRFGLFFRAAGREKIGTRTEDLELSIYATDGKLQRRFVLYAGDESGTQTEKNGKLIGERWLRSDVGWDPPKSKDLADGGESKAQVGKRLRFFVTVRDERGGFVATSRLACVETPKPM